MVGISLLKDLTFTLFIVCNVLTYLALNLPFFFLADAAVEKGVDPVNAAFLTSVIGITNCVGRGISGLITTLPGLNAFVVHNVGVVLCGVSVLCCGFLSHYVSFVVCAALYGFFVGTYAALAPVVLVDLVGLDKLTCAVGLLFMFRGMGSILMSPMAGAVYDVSGGYKIPFFVGGSIIILGSACSFASMILKRYRVK